MTEADITAAIITVLPGTDVQVACQEDGSPEIVWGDTFFFYDPRDGTAPDRRFPYATLVTKDYGEFDNVSQLDRAGIFRLNIGVGKETFHALFPEGPEHDFATLDVLMPHPIYGSMFWVSVLNPGEETFEKVKPLLKEAYNLAAARHGRRAPSS